MDTLLFIIAILCALTGFAGAILPVIPGPPLSLIALFLTRWSGYSDYTVTFLTIFTIITLIITLSDYVIPAWMTNRFGGSKSATNGSILGLIAGIFLFPPLGMIICPFIGAFLGELIENKDTFHAFKIAFLSFIAFLINTGIKLIFSSIALYYILQVLF